MRRPSCRWWVSFSTAGSPNTVPRVEIYKGDSIDGTMLLTAASVDVTNGLRSFDGADGATPVSGLIAHMNLHTCLPPITLDECSPFSSDLCPRPSDTSRHSLSHCTTA